MKWSEEEALKAAVAKAQAEFNALKADPVLSERLEVAWHALSEAEKASQIATQERGKAIGLHPDKGGHFSASNAYETVLVSDGAAVLV